MKELMEIGPPVYWVTKGTVDYNDVSVQNKMCGGVNCIKSSIIEQLYTASKQKET